MPEWVSMGEFHRSVMCDEIIAALAPCEDKTYVDATLGGGGHTRALLEAGAARVISLDMDGEAIAYVGQNLACFVDRLSLHHSNFHNLADVLDGEQLSEVDGVVFDLGISWHQIRSQERGFSYQGEGGLDMRFDPQGLQPTALDIIRGETAQQIEKILEEYGEEPRARQIARAISENRKSISTTSDLMNLLEKLVGPKGLRKTAMRVFQALRIAVNDELANLETGLDAAVNHLAPGGRVAVLSYHSLEDRMVKNLFRQAEDQGTHKRVNKKVITAGYQEVRTNPAARSAKLRILEKL